MSLLDPDCRQIEEIDAQISELDDEAAISQERLDNFKYPVLTLPPEILSEIFIHFLPAYPICLPLTGPNPPTRLTQICHTWREIAVATPSLWRAIILLHELEGGLPPARLAQEVSIWVRRSIRLGF
ncbi:hypothetical protein C8R46DRAFT_1053194 [Mycena filopes]|nr:hypothetical protein C8R46DRAFT_1053194 [Mycena filopes]